jgi:ATP-dependent Clp protease protease subunit
MFLPSIIENDGRGLRQFDLPSKLFEQNIITLFGEVRDETAYAIITQLLYLDSLDTEDDINFYINSPGGSVYAGLAIYDVMNNMKKKVNTVGMGMCASMGHFLLSSGTGERRCLPNARLMAHSVSSGTSGTYHDQKVDLRETEYLQNKLMSLLSDFTKGKLSKEDIENMTLRDNYHSPEEAIEYGFIDKIIV